MPFSKNLRDLTPKLSLFNVLLATFITTVTWSFLFQIDKSTNVLGVVEPKGNVISLQNRFESKIKEVLINVGDTVSKNQILFVLDSEQEAGELDEEDNEEVIDVPQPKKRARRKKTEE